MTEVDRTTQVSLAEYTEVVAQFRALTEIRFKLLTYLPLGTVAAAVFVPENNDLVKQPAISAFAFVVTLCIATYNKRNDQHYDELVSRAAELERELQIEHGSFSDRPKSWLKYGFIAIGHRGPIGLIYAASSSLWAYLFTAALVNKDHGLMWLKYAAPAVVIVCWQVLSWMEKARSKKQREVVESLMKQLLGSDDADSQGKPAETIAGAKTLVERIAAESILGIKKDKATRRVNYYWNGYEQKRGRRAASALLSDVIDLPARWIEDVSSGRR
jgi:hypothetical protein